jgi:hypothetical protein
MISEDLTPQDAPLTLVEIRHERSKLVGLLELAIAHLDEVREVPSDPSKECPAGGSLADKETSERRACNGDGRQILTKIQQDLDPHALESHLPLARRQATPPHAP